MPLPSPVSNIKHPLFTKFNINVLIKRDDLIHPIISGNKWRKLKDNLAYAKSTHKKGILSFGGAFSNHIHALAYACNENTLASVGVIRGEPSYQNNFTLSWARHWGMRLHFVDRKTYKRRHDADYQQELQSLYPDHLIVPEGGTNHFALGGVSDVINELNQQATFDTLMLPTGSGGTLAGLISADHNQHQILGVAVLKEGQHLVDTVTGLLPEPAKSYNNWQLLTQYHGGGYAKFSEQDCSTIAAFSQATSIPFEPVYSGKMLLALLDLVSQGYFPKHHTVMLLHTGGLQGLGGLAQRKLIKASQWHLPSAPQAQ